MRLSRALLGVPVIVARQLSGPVYAGFELHKAAVVESEQRTFPPGHDDAIDGVDA